jgi:hypothetical protein
LLDVWNAFFEFASNWILLYIPEINSLNNSNSEFNFLPSKDKPSWPKIDPFNKYSEEIVTESAENPKDDL